MLVNILVMYLQLTESVSYRVWSTSSNFHYSLFLVLSVAVGLVSGCDETKVSRWKKFIKKKVLLRERKRHTARGVASARYAVLSNGKGRGVTHPVMMVGGTPSSHGRGGDTPSSHGGGWGVPHPDLAGGTPPPSRPCWGIPLVPPIQTWDGVPPTPGMGYPHHPDLGWGTPPTQTLDVVPPIQTWDGVPPYLRWGPPTWDGVSPHPDLGWGTPHTWDRVPQSGTGYPQTWNAVSSHHPCLGWGTPPPEMLTDRHVRGR